MTNPRDPSAPHEKTSLPPAVSDGVASVPPGPDTGARGSVPPLGPTDLWSGKIRVIGELGSGAMGKVLRGYDTKLRREVALKVTKLPRREMPRQQLARFAEEAQIMAQLEHPNVVPVHDLGTSPQGHGYFSMK